MSGALGSFLSQVLITSRFSNYKLSFSYSRERAKITATCYL